MGAFDATRNPAQSSRFFRLPWVASGVLAVTFFGSPVQAKPPVDGLPFQPPRLLQSQRMPQVARCSPCKVGAVATAHPLATKAALDALKKGGSAVDALVAASMMLSVVQPQSTGIGGGGFAVVVPSQGTPTALDFREVAPMATTREDYLDGQGKVAQGRSVIGGLAVAVPGYVAGLHALHQNYGKRPWKEDVEPAVEVAANGFPIGGQLADAIALMQPHLNSAAHAVYLPAGVTPTVGTVLKFPNLAKTLRHIADEGAAGFYQGHVAADIVRAVREAGGKMTTADLLGYRARWVKPLEDHALGCKAYMMPQPAAGGAQVLAMAHFIERWTASQPFPARADAVAHLLAEAMRRSFALRHHFSGDGDRPARRLTEVYPQKALDAVSAFDLARAATELVYLTDKPLNSHQNGIHTSHVSIIDAEGTRVASTHTVNLYLGSGIIAPESGVLLNNEMDDFAYSLDTSNAFGLAGSEANLVAAGKRPVSSMAPMVAICGNETLILGTPGGSRIPTTVLQVFARWRLSGMALPDAVAAPRVHQQWQSSTWTPARLDVEQAGDADEWVKGLQLRGHAVQRRGPWCNVQAVRRITGPRGRVSLEAVSDPRGEGGAIAR